MMAKLAVNGGKKVRTKKFPSFNSIGKKEEKAVIRVIRRGVLSQFLGTWHKDFYGGPEVRALEKEWAKFFKVKHAISVNSCTSGLYCAIGAAGVGPGDEVIVSPYTMSASATAPLIFNAIPVFADIEENYFCLDPQSVEARITKFTKAIIVVDIFGQPYDVERINLIARKHKLLVIEDSAQAPGAKYKNKYTGTLGDIGVFSLNYHKHIHTGEGGMVTTNNDQLAERVRLIRNHAEAVVREKGTTNLINMVGFNLRMTELEAAIAREQLKKLPYLLEKRLRNAAYLSKKLASIPCLDPPKIRSYCRHVFYLYMMKFNTKIAGIHRRKFVRAVQKEGVSLGQGYVRPLYLEPIFQEKIAYGNKGCPWSCEKYKGKVSYNKGICPVAEEMHYNILTGHSLVQPSMTKKDLDDVIKTIEKVYKLRKNIK